MKINKHRNIDQLYDELPEPERTTALILRQLVLETIEVKKEKLSWSAPFYYGHSPICFIWPASIPWGKLDKGVALGFWRGKLLSQQDFFDVNHTKYTFRKVFYGPEEIEIEVIQSLLLEAASLDEEIHQSKKKKH